MKEWLKKYSYKQGNAELIEKQIYRYYYGIIICFLTLSSMDKKSISKNTKNDYRIYEFSYGKMNEKFLCEDKAAKSTDQSANLAGYTGPPPPAPPLTRPEGSSSLSLEP